MPLTPERWQQVARIYERIVDHDPATRDALLTEACAGDAALRREVESLLSQEAADVIVDQPVWTAAAQLFESIDVRPSTLGPYRIDGSLGAGGMGEVFHATDTRLNRRVAIKVLRGSAAIDAQMRARFAREARAVAALTHPHICTLYDIGRDDQVDFLVMEYLEGQTLASRLGRGPLPVDEAVTCAVEIASALEHAHRHGIVHRDLKPGNVMLTAGGAKLLDFGLAKFRSAGAAREGDADDTRAEAMGAARQLAAMDGNDSQMTRRGAIVGTIRYMSPEQIQGRAVDARTDVFSFGALLHEVFTGRRAFEGDDATAVRASILEHEPPPVSSLQPAVPAGVDEIVRRCLAKTPDERWESAAEVVEQLKRVAGTVSPVSAGPRAAWRWVAAALAATITGLLVWLSMAGVNRVPATDARQIRSIAVLPLQNLSRDPDQEYVADGMTEQLIAELAKIKGLRVISPLSVMQYKAAPKPLPEIVRELRVDAVIEGSVVRFAETVRITVKLIRGSPAEVIWAQSYERPLRDLLALQSSVARAISGEVGITLTPQEEARLAARTVDPDKHLQVMLGRHHLAKSTEEALRKAVQYFETAIAQDPGNAPAHAGLAEAYSALNGFYMDPLEAMPKAKAAAQAALRLDDSLADAHAALGYVHLVYDWDGPSAERELLRALDLNPSLAIVRLKYAAYLTSQARFDEAIREIRRAVDLDPQSIKTHTFGTLFLLFARSYDEADELARKGLEFEPDSAFTLTFQGYGLAQQGRFEEALENLQRAVQLDNSPTIRAVYAHVLAVSGRKTEALQVVHQIEVELNDRYFCPYEVASVYVSLGDHDRAHTWFRKGVDGRADCMAWLGIEPWLDPFRKDPRYQDLLRDIGLDAHRRARH
jgi:serine/threonine-protein kinase